MNKPCQTVYFGDKSLHFTASADCDAAMQTDSAVYVCRDAESELSPANILKIFATCDSIVCLADDAAAVFERWASQFRFVRAAGGIVVAPQGEVVMIRRSWHWDLPKGHIEPGESAEECAVREIEEETGVKGAKIAAFLCNTLHAYNVYGAWELKNTAWYWLNADGRVPLTPQRSEGIMRADWCDERTRNLNLQTAYATVKQVFARYEQIKK